MGAKKYFFCMVFSPDGNQAFACDESGLDAIRKNVGIQLVDGVDCSLNEMSSASEAMAMADMLANDEVALKRLNVVAVRTQPELEAAAVAELLPEILEAAKQGRVRVVHRHELDEPGSEVPDGVTVH